MPVSRGNEEGMPPPSPHTPADVLRIQNALAFASNDVEGAQFRFRGFTKLTDKANVYRLTDITTGEASPSLFWSQRLLDPNARFHRKLQW